jgi:uncharacterized membrane protein YqaE (UPF0057 family)
MAKAFKDRSRKSKEKLADSCMNIRNIIHGGLAITTLVSSISGLVSVFFSTDGFHNTGGKEVNFLLNLILTWTVLGFTPAIVIGNYLKNKAMDIYDGL